MGQRGIGFVYLSIREFGNMNRRIIFVNGTSSFSGGAEQNTLLLINQLAEAGWSPHVILPSSGAFEQVLTKNGITSTIIPGTPSLSPSFYLGLSTIIPNPFTWLAIFFQGIAWARRIRRFLRDNDTAIVQTGGLWTHAFAGWAARKEDIPAVAYFQDLVSPKSGFGLYLKFAKLWAKCIPSRIICLSEKIATQFSDIRGASDKVQVIWSIIDVEKFRPRELKSEEAGIIKMGTVGRLTPWKGQHVALQAAKMLKERGINFKWIFAGDADLGSENYLNILQKNVAKWGLENEIEFIGWTDQMPEIYQSIDIFIHVPTSPEPFGLVLAEALASGLPIIASSGGGIDDYVVAGGGIIVPPNDPASIAFHIEELIKSRDDRYRRAKLARKIAVEKFSSDAHIQQWNVVYESLLEDRKWINPDLKSL